MTFARACFPGTWFKLHKTYAIRRYFDRCLKDMIKKVNLDETKKRGQFSKINTVKLGVYELV